MRRSLIRFVTMAVTFVLFVVALHDADASRESSRSETIAGNTAIQSFNKAKKMMREVFAGRERTFYCDCAYSENRVDLQGCGYQPKKNSKLARQFEWEHVVPAEAFGQPFPEWREGHPECIDRKGQPFKGRHCAAKVALLFRYMEADLYNLQPAIG
jgi:deoxyribonuclease I